MTQASLKCSAGFYCLGKASVPTPTDGVTGNVCPAGNYCPEGTISPIKCPIGTFLNYTGAKDRSECKSCTPGKYCASEGLGTPTGNCKQGYYCTEGSKIDTPVICPLGFICPTTTITGTVKPQACPSGQITNDVGSYVCVDPPTKTYCTRLQCGLTCSQGMYCPGQNRSIECPVGTYNQLTGKELLSDCLSCPSEYSCEKTGTKIATTKCDPGFICTGGTITPRPSNVGTSKFAAGTQGGKMCIPGEICPLQSSAVTTCPAGKYCKDYAAGFITGSCEGGYYCPPGQKIKNPNICPSGTYCPPGSEQPINCPKGKYSPSLGASSETFCQPCPPGQVCTSEGLIGTNINCPQGYYCPKGVDSENPESYECPAGYECPVGSVYPRLCQPGYYQDLTKQAACKVCSAGFYCDGTDSTKQTPCPPGYYCLQGTKFQHQYPCAPGTYNSLGSGQSSTDCLYVPVGYYNDGYGVSDYTKLKIAKGYYSQIDQIRQGKGKISPKGTPCPRFHYCPEGTPAPIACPDGLTNFGEGSGSKDDCVPCEPGKYCRFTTYFSKNAFKNVNFNDLILANVPDYSECAAGYICSGGSNISEPTDRKMGYICPTGSYCLQGAIFEKSCSVGTYQDEKGGKLAVCKPCPIGSYCPRVGMSEPDQCERGHICPNLGTIYPTPCKSGFYNPDLSQTTCKPCPAGAKCDQQGLDKPNGVCQEGFVCNGAATATPYTSISSTNGRCPIGNYCPTGSDKPIKCADTTYQPNDGQSQCLSCPKGMICSINHQEGSTMLQGQCDEGWLCENGVPQEGSNATTCRDKYCPPGAPFASICPDGKQVDKTTGQCKGCVAGSKCQDGATKDCDLYHYCDSSNSNYFLGRLCPNGTYHDVNGDRTLSSVLQCLPCPEKKFCMGGRVIDNCNPGYICIKGADSPTPHKTSAYPCPTGYYCSAGVSAGLICPAGMYTFQEGSIQIEQCGYCQPGFFCEYGALQPTKCPPGNYCPLGVQQPTKCTQTTYNPNYGGKDREDCLACKKGFYCNDEEIYTLDTESSNKTQAKFASQYICPLGNYCLNGTWNAYECIAGTYSDSGIQYNPPGSITECYFCPEHYYCPKGSKDRYKYPCQGGTYCPRGSDYPLLCPPGQYCKQKIVGGLNVIEKGDCPENFYCPQSTTNPIPCKKEDICKKGSSFPSRTILTATICKPGEYFGLGVCLPCEAGFVCEINTSMKYPVYLKTEGGYECPPGNYCPRGSSAPIKCPAGSFRREKRGEALKDCILCPTDAYNDQPGQVTCTKCGRGAIGNSNTNYQSCECKGKFRQWRRSDNQCICQIGYNEPSLPTQEQETTTDSQDCVPEIEQQCGSGTHYDSSFKTCVSDSICTDSPQCNGKGATDGYYSSSAKKCLCKNVPNTYENACDTVCQNQTLKAFITSASKICLKAGINKECYDKSEFGNSIFLDGIECPASQKECDITSFRGDGSSGVTTEADPVFVSKWKLKYPKYQSPLSSSAKNSTTKRLLQQTTTDYNTQRILCTRPYNPVSFEVSRQHYPVYLKDSLLNTNANFDDGVFDILETKLVQGNMSIATFMFSFKAEGVYVFADSSFLLTSQTIVRVSTTLCGTGVNVYPMTEDNLAKFDISPQELQLSTLSDGLIAIPIVFILLTTVSTILQYLWESKIERDEAEIRLKRAGRRRDYSNQDGKLDKKQYLADLYRLIKSNMAEVNRLINSHDDRINLIKLLKDRTSLLRELGDGGKDTVSDLKQQLRFLLEQLRFPDGQNLKDMLASKQMQKEFQKKMEAEPDEEDEEAKQKKILEDIDNLERESGDQEDEEDDMEYEDSSDQPSEDVLSEGFAQGEDEANRQHQDSSDEDNSPYKQKGDASQMDMDLERKRKINRELSKRKNDFKDKITDLIDDEQQRDNILQGFDNKMRSLDDLLQSEMDRQNAALKAKREARRNRKKEAVAQITETVSTKEERIAQLKKEREALEDKKQEILDNGMKDHDLQEHSEQEKQDILAKVERQFQEKQEIIRRDYLAKLDHAKNDKEKERIVDEMQRRLLKMEEEMARERSEQEKNLEKIMMLRKQKRVQKLAHLQQKAIDEKDQQIESLKAQIIKDKAKAFVDFGGDLPQLLDEAVLRKVKNVVDKSNLQPKLDLDKREQEQMEMLRVQQRMEMDNARIAGEKEVEDGLEMDKQKLEQDILDKHQKQKDKHKTDFATQIAGAKSEDARKKLMDEARAFDKHMDEQLSNERLQQDRVLEEKKKNRMNLRKVKEIEMEKRHMEEQARKETEFLQKKYDKMMGEHAQTFKTDLQKAAESFERKGEVDKAVLLVGQASNEILERKLRLLINKQFFELEKYLGTLYNQLALEKMSAMQKLHARISTAEQEAYATLTGDALVARLAQLKELSKAETEALEGNFKGREKEQEAEIRERLEKKAFEEQKKAREEEEKRREELIKEVIARNANKEGSESSIELAQKLIEVNKGKNAEELEKLEVEKEASIERIQLQFVAENEAEVQQMQKNIEEQLDREREMVDERMKKHKDEILGERKKKLDERMKQMSDLLSQNQKDQIMKQYLLELSRLERAIAQERDEQMRKMRQRIVKKKIAAERLKKEEDQEKRVQMIKRQIGKFLLTAIQQARLKVQQEKKVLPPPPTNKVVDRKGTNSGLRRTGTSQSKARGSISSQPAKVAPMGVVEQAPVVDLRLLMEQWKERVNSNNEPDYQKVWDMHTLNGGRDSPKSSMSKASKITGFQGNLKGLGAQGGAFGVNLGPNQQNYTLEELMRRVKRVERLTENLKGKFGNVEVKKEAEKVIASVANGTLPTVMANNNSKKVQPAKFAGKK